MKTLIKSFLTGLGIFAIIVLIVGAAVGIVLGLTYLVAHHPTPGKVTVDILIGIGAISFLTAFGWLINKSK